MSIPNSFDPLGAFVNELPYVQPVMTGYTTWSNQPSFGWDISGLKYSHPNYANFRAFDKNLTSVLQWIPPQDYGKAWYDAGIMTFDRPITLHGIEVVNFPLAEYSERLKGGIVFFNDDGMKLAEFIFPDDSPPSVRMCVNVEPTIVQRIRIQFKGSLGVSDIQFIATYNPNE